MTLRISSKQRLRWFARDIAHPSWIEKNRRKIFCIGLNKTGTTTLELALKQLGFRVGNQRRGELLLDDWARRDFRRILRLANTADAFQDVPFSLPYTFQAIDNHFPNAQFVLTVRDSAEQWYASLTRYHSKLWADGKRVPTPDDLRSANYVYPGRPWEGNRLIFTTPECDPYEQNSLLEYYELHNSNVREYFRHRKGKLIEINVARKSDYRRLVEFLGRDTDEEGFAWLNRSS